MKFIDKKIKLSTIFPNKKLTAVNSKISFIPIKVIPAYVENEERLIKRKLILNSHEVFQNEKKNKYKSLYLNEVFNGLYQNKRNYSQQRNLHYNTGCSRNHSSDSFPMVNNSSISKTLILKPVHINKSPILLKNNFCTNGFICKETKGKKIRFQNGIPFPPVKCT